MQIAFLTAAMLVPQFALAACSIVNHRTGDTETVRLRFGTVNLASTYLQPVGSLLGVTTALVSERSGWTAETIMWRCQPGDKAAIDGGRIFFLVATNGDNRVGGYWEIGNGHGATVNDGLPGVYATDANYIGLKLTMAGVILTRFWQIVPITNYDYDTQGRIVIKAKHIPPMVAELYRVSTAGPPTTSGPGTSCGSRLNTGNYDCSQPNAYIQLSSNPVSSTYLSNTGESDQIGEDSSAYFDFWGGNGVGYGMLNSMTVASNNTCVARNATPLVLFPPISVTELLQGGSRQADVQIQIECNSTGVVSGITVNQTAIGIQASQGAYTAARTLNLVTGGNGVTHLVSDTYGSDSTMAQGVGIKLSNPSAGISEMNLLGWPLAGGGGAAAGWYPALQGASPAGSSVAGYSNYTHTVTATLTRLPGATPTSGKVKATASIQVKVQ